jgi:hypothetical protein
MSVPPPDPQAGSGLATQDRAQVREVAPWHPPPTYPPPHVQRAGRTDGRGVAALISAFFGILLGLPFGLPGMVLGTLAYFLGRSATGRVDASGGTAGGRGVAVAGWVFGVVAMAIGSIVTLAWLVVLLVAISQPATSI